MAEFTFEYVHRKTNRSNVVQSYCSGVDEARLVAIHLLQHAKPDDYVGVRVVDIDQITKNGTKYLGAIFQLDGAPIQYHDIGGFFYVSPKTGKKMGRAKSI